MLAYRIGSCYESERRGYNGGAATAVDCRSRSGRRSEDRACAIEWEAEDGLKRGTTFRGLRDG